MNRYRTSGRPATITFLFTAALLIGLLIPTTGVAAATRAATGSGTVSAAVVASGATYHAISPTRLLDTRAGNGLSGTFKSRTARTFQVTGRGGIPAGATAVTGNLTVTGQTQAGYLFVGPVATNSPSSSTLNFPKGDNRANGVTVALVARAACRSPMSPAAPAPGPGDLRRDRLLHARCQRRHLPRHQPDPAARHPDAATASAGPSSPGPPGRSR